MSSPSPIAERIRPRDRDAILQSLRAGVVPRVGLQHIQVGRAKEVEALIADIDRISDGGSAIKFVIGEYGAGKSFFLNLIRAIALERKLVTVHADLSPDRRLASDRRSSTQPLRRADAKSLNAGPPGWWSNAFGGGAVRRRQSFRRTGPQGLPLRL